MYTRVLCWPIVFLHVYCSILILLIKTVRFSLPHLIGILDIHTHCILSVKVVIFTSVSFHQDLKICYEHFFFCVWINLLNAKLNASCKSQLAEFF